MPELTHILYHDAQFYYWISTGVITFLFLITAFWVKRWITRWDKQEEIWQKQGGLVTRDQVQTWCDGQRIKCPAIISISSLSDWREKMGEKGGPLTKGEHTALCKEITKEVGDGFAERIEELFEHHREWVGQELKIISNEQSALKSLVISTLTK
jgi:hypothetical protein